MSDESDNSSNDTSYDIKNASWNPCFRDTLVEREFLLRFNAEALKLARVGILVLLLVWTAFAMFDIHLNDPGRTYALLFRLLVILPIFLAIMGVTFTKYAAPIYQPLAVLVVLLIQGSIVFVVTFYDLHVICDSLGFDLPMTDGDGKFIFVLVWLVIIFMCATVLRLTVFHAVLCGAIFTLLTALSLLIYAPSAVIAVIAVPFIVTAIPVVLASSVYVQRYAREEHRAARLLELSMQKSESLLLNILPPQIAQRLKEQPTTIADGFDDVSVLFADIEGFTLLSEQYEPGVLVGILNNIFSEFDAISRRHGVEKIKTIGDAYMVAAGVPEPRADHCHAVAECALDMVAAMQHFADPSGRPIQIRVGIHTGPAIAGVIGAHKFAYDLWGDTVNTASRMESQGSAGQIQTSREIHDVLKDSYTFEWRGEIEFGAREPYPPGG